MHRCRRILKMKCSVYVCLCMCEGDNGAEGGRWSFGITVFVIN